MVLERKGKKEIGKQGRKGVKSADMLTRRPMFSLTPTTQEGQEIGVDAQVHPEVVNPKQKWSSPSEDSYTFWVEIQSKTLDTSKDLSNKDISKIHAALEGRIPPAHHAP